MLRKVSQWLRSRSQILTRRFWNRINNAFNSTQCQITVRSDKIGSGSWGQRSDNRRNLPPERIRRRNRSHQNGIWQRYSMRMRRWKESNHVITDGEKADLSQEKYPNINVITGALKSYLRLLPIPLITFIVHPLLIDAMRKLLSLERILWLVFFFTEHKNNDLKISSIKHALKSLPKAHYDTLKYVVEHLHRYFCRYCNHFIVVAL